jgi:serine O-acetyltransferase
MLIRAIVKVLFGGVWKLKENCLHASFKPWRKFLTLIYRARQESSGSSIAWNSHFAGVPYFPHGLNGIFVSHAARIGRNCIIFQQVTIGTNTLVDSESIGAPVIGDDCYIGVGAKIIGNVRIGNNVRVGANCVVTKDVPDDCVVVSGEQINLRRPAGLNNRFYAYTDRWVFFDDGKWVEETDGEIIRKLESTKRFSYVV